MAKFEEASEDVKNFLMKYGTKQPFHNGLRLKFFVITNRKKNQLNLLNQTNLLKHLVQE